MASRVAVIGAGAWGTTLAVLAARAGHRAALYVRDPDSARESRTSRSNPRAPSGLVLPRPSSQPVDLAEACDRRRGRARGRAESADAAGRDRSRASCRVGDLVSAAKGLEVGTARRMTEVLAEGLGRDPAHGICALSGPNLAAEIAAGKPAVSVVASEDLAAAEPVRDRLISPQFRLYTNEDVIGVEMGGALKNIIAIGAGMADGLAAGDNAKAAFITRGIAEIARLGVAVGAKPLTFRA